MLCDFRRRVRTRLADITRACIQTDIIIAYIYIHMHKHISRLRRARHTYQTTWVRPWSQFDDFIIRVRAKLLSKTCQLSTMSALRTITRPLTASLAPLASRRTPAAVLPCISSLRSRNFASTRLVLDELPPEDYGAHASIDPSITEDWPGIEDRDRNDVGHSTTGPEMIVGCVSL